MFMLTSNQPIKIACLSSKINGSINVEWHTCDKNDKQLFQWRLEKLWSFDKARNIENIFY